MLRLTPFAAPALVACAVLGGLAGTAQANSTEYKAAIWVDPDGCEHWVMDGGQEGFMSPHLDKEGMPVCRKLGAGSGTCKVLESDSLFAVGSARIPAAGKSMLMEYFNSIAGSAVVIDGHTDATGGDRFNLNLSVARARAVAALAEEANVSTTVRGFGEQVPVASNDTAAGRAQNRRVEISCAVAQ